MDRVDWFVGRKLKFARLLRGMTQCELGKAVGVTLQQIQKYETGVNRISASRLYYFSQVLSTTISYFYEGIESALKNNSNEMSLECGKHTPEMMVDLSSRTENPSSSSLSDSAFIDNNNKNFFREDLSSNFIDDSRLLSIIKHYKSIKSDKVRKKIVDLFSAVVTSSSYNGFENNENDTRR